MAEITSDLAKKSEGGLWGGGGAPDNFRWDNIAGSHGWYLANEILVK